MENINITSGATLVYCRNIKAKATNVIVMLRSLQNERGRKLQPSKTIIWSAALLIIRLIVNFYCLIHCIQTNKAQMPADYGTQHSADVDQNTCSFTSTPTYTFMVRCLIQHMDNSNTHCINILFA